MKPDLHFSDVSYALAQMDMASVDALAGFIRQVRGNGGTVFTFGNGGSHSTASHFAQDLVRTVGVRAVCLGDMVSGVLASGNDEGWDEMYADVLGRMIDVYDAAVGFSCSGRSKNVQEALAVAKQRGNMTAGLTGSNPDSVINFMKLDVLVRVPEIEDIRVQEDVHMIMCHAVVRSLMDVE